MISVLAGLFSCNVSEPADSNATGRRYTPFSVSQFWEYSVRFLEADDTLQKEIRHEVLEVEENGEDRVFTIGVFEWQDDQWVQQSNILARQNSTQLLITENNSISLELIYPVVEGKSWFRFPNADESLSEFPLQMLNIGAPFNEWENTLTVESVSQLGIQLKKIFAADTGLVFVLIEPEFEEWILVNSGIE